MTYRLGTLAQAAENIVGQILDVRPGETVLIVTDQYTRHLMEPVKRGAARVVGDSHVVWRLLEELGARDRDARRGLDPEEMARSRAFRALLGEVRDSQVAIFAAVSLGREVSLRDQIRQAGVHGGGRFLHLPNLTEDIMCMACCADQQLMHEYTLAVHRLAARASWASVTSPAGTDVWTALGLRWDVAGSKLGPGEWGNVGAETYTCPVNIDGTWVTDGGMGDIFTAYGLLREHPLRLTLRAGCIVGAECGNAELRGQFHAYADSDPLGNGWRIGQFALATNPEVSELGLIGVNMQDEKALTHIACGTPRPDRTMQGIVPERFQWTSHVHVDCTCQDTTVTLYDPVLRPVVVLKDGRPADAVYAEMGESAVRLRRRLEAIRHHRERNDRLPESLRERIVRFD